MNFRSQAGLQEGQRPARRTLLDFNHVILCKVVRIYPQHHTADLVPARGGFIRNARIVSVGGTTETSRHLPQVLNYQPQLEREGVRYLDEYQQLHRRDTMAIATCIDGNMQSFVCWLLPPDFEEGSFLEHNLSLDRHAGDIYEVQYALDNPNVNQLRDMVTNHQGAEDDEANPAPWELPRQSNWEQVWPDRRRLSGPDDALAADPPMFDPSDTGSATGGQLQLGLETYEKVGYGFDPTAKLNEDDLPPAVPPTSHLTTAPIDQPWQPLKAFPELPWSSRPSSYPDGISQLNRRPLGGPESGIKNFDDDYHPWRRHRENGIRFARGLRFNQRWGTFAELTRAGDIRLLAEGFNANVNPEAPDAADKADPEAATIASGKNWGSLYFMARIEERHTAKGSFSYFRKRVRFGGQLENFDTQSGAEDDPVDVRRWGHQRIRTQRTFQAISRMEAILGARDSVNLFAGAVDDGTSFPDGQWSRSDPANGGDFQRYQDRLKWRNPDSNESANIFIRSVRGKLSDFGSDREGRGRDVGGEIHIETAPLEGNHALIAMAAKAAEGGALLTALVQNGLHDKGQSDGAAVDYKANSFRDNANISFVAATGMGGKNGDNADVALRAHTGRDNAHATLEARAGLNGSGSDAVVDVIAEAHDRAAVVAILAMTDYGDDASVSIKASPATGIGQVEIAAEGDGAIISLSAEADEGGRVDISGSDEVNISAVRGLLALIGQGRLTIGSNGEIDISAPAIRLTGHIYLGDNVEITGNLKVDKNLQVLGNSEVDGTELVKGVATFDSDLGVVGNAAVDGNAIIIGTLGVTGDTTVHNIDITGSETPGP